MFLAEHELFNEICFSFEFDRPNEAEREFLLAVRNYLHLATIVGRVLGTGIHNVVLFISRCESTATSCDDFCVSNM